MRFVLAMLAAVLFSACGNTASTCGANPCGACAAPCVNAQRCVNGAWRCGCDCPDAGCGPSPCGACPTGCAAMDQCLNGTWDCRCACP
ncbi:MAG: hypothetical protein AB1730_14785 [Myxococcota bacterium]